MKTVPLLVAALLGGAGGALLVGALTERGGGRSAVREIARPEASPEVLEAIAELRREVAALKARPGTEPSPAIPGDPAAREPEPAGDEPPAAAGEDAAAGTESAADVLKEVLGKPFTSVESNRLFSWTVFHKDRIDDLVKQIEAEVLKDPQNADLRVALATALVGKLTNATTPGPQQGLVWSQAEAAYDAALKINPDHWMAGYGKAFGTSMIPAFLGTRPKAIRQFEDLMTRQEAMPSHPDHAQTYFRLGDLYKEAGNIEKARAVWERGRGRFPDNRQLREAIETLEQR